MVRRIFTCLPQGPILVAPALAPLGTGFAHRLLAADDQALAFVVATGASPADFRDDATPGDDRRGRSCRTCQIAAKAEVRESRADENGVGTMIQVGFVEIPPGETVCLDHGGHHITLMGLTGPLVEGEVHEAMPILEGASRIEIEFQIDPPAGMDGMDQSKTDNGDPGG